MCGIIACRTDGDAASVLVRGLSALEYRGYDSVGVAIRTDAGGVVHLKSVERIEGLRKRLTEWDGPALSGTGIGHTRWATHGGVSETNAHPHHDCTGRISLVHNGIIDNADELRLELEATGHVFSSDVDSEVIAHLVEAAQAEGEDLVDALASATTRLRGSWAIAVLDAASGRVVATAHRAPLLCASSGRGWFVASDVRAIAPWVDGFQVVRDGDTVEIGPAGVWRHDRVEVAEPALIPHLWVADDPTSQGYVDYMAKEIEEQPAVAARMLDRTAGTVASGVLWRELGLPPFERVAIIGCGTSLNAGAVIASALRRFGGVPATTIVASEAADAVIEPGTLVLAISQSGETADVLAALDQPGFEGRPVLALTNTTYSTLARRADAVLDCAAGPEIGVAATKTFVAQVLVGVAAGIAALTERGRLDRTQAVALTDELRRVPDLLAASLSVALHSVPELVPGIASQSGFLFLGRSTGLAYAAEGALKLKELTYRWAEHYPAGELKHGPLALVEQGTPVIVVDSGDPRIAGSVAEVAARGANVIGIGGSGSRLPALGRSLDAPIVDRVHPCGPIESVVPMQMLARELALALGKDVDKPRNLAKSVTVE